MDNSREKHCRYIAEEADNRKNILEYRWEVYVKDKEELIKREFLVSITHPKGGGGCLDLCEGSYHQGKVSLQSYWTMWV